ncbi:hypothetical protein BJV77DRAFT_1159565 [Russula vinacea]|nr:hypothetical protein BJV77DRAFT_1159565 [Russula vinacea]
MRFTNWPALTDAFVIFTVTLSSLIPAANASGPVAAVTFSVPETGTTYIAGTLTGISWEYEMNPSFSEEFLLGYACNISLVNSKFGTNYTLATGVTLLVSSATNATALIQPGVLRYPWNAKIGGGYSVSLESDLIGNWSSGVFSIAF